MNKTDCNITKDLLPLYIEELCSQASVEYVQEHLQECRECRDSYELLKKTELISQAVAKQEVNAVKKLKKNITERVLFIMAMVIIVFLLMINTYHFTAGFFYLLMPLTMLATHAVFRQKHTHAPASTCFKVLYALQLLLILYSMILCHTMIAFLAEDKNFMGIPTIKTGVVLSTQLTISSVASLLLLGIHLYRATMKRTPYLPFSNLSLLCIFLNLSYLCLMHQMSTLSGFITVLQKNTLSILAIGITTLAFLHLAEHILSKDRHSQTLE